MRLSQLFIFAVITASYSAVAVAKAPEFSSSFTNAYPNENISGVFFTFQATDPNGPNSKIRFSLAGSDRARLRIEPTRGGLYFRTPPDYENPSDSDEDNEYKIIVIATDRDGDETRAKATVIVQNVDDENPTIRRWKKSYSVAENSLAVQTFTVADDFSPDSVTLSVSSSESRPDGADFVIQDKTLKFSRAPDFENPRDEDKNNTYRFVLTARDGAGNTRNYNQTVVVTDQATRKIRFGVTPAVQVQEDTSTPKKYCAEDGLSFRHQEIQVTGYGSYETAAVLGWLGRHTCTATGNTMWNTSDEYHYQVYESDPATTVKLTMENSGVTCSAANPVCGNPGISVYAALSGSNTQWVGSDYSEDEVKTIELPRETGNYIIYIQDTSQYFAGVGKQSYILEFSRESASSSNLAPLNGRVSENLGFPLEKPINPLHIGAKSLKRLGTHLESNSAQDSSSLINSRSFTVTRKVLTNAEKKALRKRKYTKAISTKARADLRRIYKKHDVRSVSGFRTISLDEKDLRIARRLIKEGQSINALNKADGQTGNRSPVLNPIATNNTRANVRHLVELLNLAYPSFEFSVNSLVFSHQKFSPDRDYAEKQKRYMDMINLPAGLNRIGAEVKSPIVAVIDTGGPTSGSIADRATNFVEGGYDFVSNVDSAGDGDGFDGDPTDPNACEGPTDKCSGKYRNGSHGTHVATTIGAKNDGLDINGFGVRVASLRALGRYGWGSSSDICNAIAYAADLENDTGTTFSEVSGGDSVSVINMSLGSTGSCQCQSVIDQAISQGVTVVASAGNHSSDVYGFPASCDGVISVAATNSLGIRSYYSAFNDLVDIAAPGGDANSVFGRGNLGDYVWAFDRDSGLDGYQGTSMAAPIVSGVIANLYAEKPSIKPATIDGLVAKQMISNDRGPADYDPFYGAGVIDLLKGLRNAGRSSRDAVTYVRPPSGVVLGLKSSTTFSIQKEGRGQASVELPFSDATALRFSKVNVDDSGFGTYRVRVNRNLVYWDDRHVETMSVPVTDIGGTRNLSVPVLFQKGVLGNTQGPQNIANLMLWNRTNENVTRGRAFHDIRGSEELSLSIEDGEYKTIISTDIDQDGKYCDFGELCWKNLSWTNSKNRRFRSQLVPVY